MGQLAGYVAGGLVAATALTYLTAPGETEAVFRNARGAFVHSQPEVDRSNKGDRLKLTRTAVSEPAKITLVEVVGLREAAIVYRDRDGRVLFQTDPLANVTILAKDVTLPKVTIRESARINVEPVKIDAVKPAAERPRPPGCESAFSPLTSPGLSHVIRGCVAKLGANTRFAAAVR